MNKKKRTGRGSGEKPKRDGRCSARGGAETKRSERRREGARRRGGHEGDAKTPRGRPAGPGRGAPSVSLGGAEELIVGRRAWLVFLILLVALWVAFYHDIFFGGKSLVSPDAVAPAGFVKVGKEALQSGVYPLWNPYIFCGMPSYSSLSYNPYVYPVGLVLKVLWPLMRLPMMWLLIYYLAGGLSLFLLLRKHALPAAAAAFGAVAFMFTPNLVAVGAYGHGSQLMASMYIPIIFLMANRLLERGSAAWAAGLAALFGLQLLRGHVQISYYTAIMIGIMTLYWTIVHFRKNGIRGPVRPLGLAVLAVALALGLASVLYIPVHNYSELSVRAAGEGGGLDIARAGMWSLSFKELSTLVIPGALGFGGGTYWGSMPFTDYPNGYAGVLTLAFALFAALKLRGNTTVGLLSVLALVALAMSFGRHLGPVYEMAYRWVPFFNKFRVPVMVVVLLHFSMTCLAGYGVALVIGGAGGGRRAGPARAGTEGEGPRARGAGGAGRGGGGVPMGSEEGHLGRGAVDGVWSRAAGKTVRWIMGAVAVGMVIFFAAGSRVQGGYTDLIADARGGAFARSAAAAAFRSLRADVLVVGLVVICSAALVLGFRRRAISLGVLSVGLILLSCVDLWRVDYRLMKPNLHERGAAGKTVEDDPVAVFLSKDKDLFRVYPLGRKFYDNTLNAHKVASVGGYHAATSKLWNEWANAHMDVDLWTSAGLRPLPAGRGQRLPAGAMMVSVRRMLGIKYVVADGNIRVGPELKPVFRERGPGDPRGPGGVVYQTNDWLPKAFCVANVRRVATGRDALREILRPSFDPEAFAVVEDDVETTPSAAGSARVASYGVNHIEVDVTSEGPTFLVVGDLYMEGWKATLDGREAPVHKTNFLLRGVAVPAGSHRVRLQYFDPGLAQGLKLGAGCAIVIIAMVLPATGRGLGSLRRRRRTS